MLASIVANQDRLGLEFGRENKLIAQCEATLACLDYPVDCSSRDLCFKPAWIAPRDLPPNSGTRHYSEIPSTYSSEIK